MAKKDSKFYSLTTSRTGRSLFPVRPVPSIRVTKNRSIDTLAMTPEIHRSLGSPEYISVEANPEEELLRIIKREIDNDKNNGPANAHRGIRKLSFVPYMGGREAGHIEGYYAAALTHSAGKATIMEHVADGYYLPLGGGIFKYHGPDVPRR